MTATSRSAAAPAQDAPALDAQALLEMSPVKLDAVFQNAPAGAIPAGRARGTIIAFPGSPVASPAARILGALFWRGKVFNPATEDLKNLVSPLGIRAIRARVFVADSWLDGRACVVLDYSQTSKVAGWIRDEIREVAPGLFLGLVWGVGRVFGGRRLVLRFALTFPVTPGA